MRTSIAIILLTGPSLYQFVHYLREYGLTFKKEDGWGVFPIVAMILLFTYVGVTLSSEVDQILRAEFFPSRGFLIFLVTGVAFSVAIFPKQFAESSGALPRTTGIRLEWLVAVPAWIWISVVMTMVALRFTS